MTYLHEPLARPEAPRGDAGLRFGYWVMRVRESSAQPEAGDAVRRLAEDTSDVQLDRVLAERDLAEESTARRGVIEKFEASDPND